MVKNVTISVMMAMLLLSACTGPPTTVASVAPSAAVSPSVPDAVIGTPADALTALIQAERQASIDRDLATLDLLWSPDSRIVDGRNTAESNDDYLWVGRDAILDRYVVAVFPNPPPPLTDPGALKGVSVQDKGNNTATGINGGDRWRLVYAEGRWWLQELVYQQP